MDKLSIASTAPSADFLTDTLRRLVECDSPVGYNVDIKPLMEGIFRGYGLDMTWDRKGTGYVRLEGRDSSRCVCMGAHLDTIGLIVRGFNTGGHARDYPEPDGSLRVRQLGGMNYSSAEGCTCRIHCRNGNVVPAQLICDKHSVHSFVDARAVPRDEDHMSLSVIGDVHCMEDAKDLGITQGAIVAVDPEFELFDNGYIVSRHIDDKAAVAALVGLVDQLSRTGERPAVDTLLAFPIYEEIGHGGSYVPDGVDEYVALDITLLGPDYDADEHHVGVIAADAHGPYDWALTNTLISCAEQVCEPDRWDIQSCFHYSTDAMAAYKSGADVYAAAFGPACMNTHGRERCHIDALVETERLACAYALGMGRD
ncbi:MAG: peptidase M42 [Atopobiaceae bacterium]|jgi:putative aminopeptidase FrvX|nr:peptidase M42 [Atopobiaceae bacterium]MCI2173438.1 peptidase M42 [Atopobiaceae bacterium]MCI2207433.1 peptidase M42 [Atopobiaceae bacterium]